MFRDEMVDDPKKLTRVDPKSGHGSAVIDYDRMTKVWTKALEGRCLKYKANEKNAMENPNTIT
jgi:hypothetical protein